MLVPDDDHLPNSSPSVNDPVGRCLRRSPSTSDSHANLEDWAALDFLAGDYAPARRYTTADWFGDQ
jgi:hypothetical protein